MTNQVDSFVGLGNLTFRDILQVKETSQGFSQSCFMLTTTKGQFIAKRFSQLSNFAIEKFVYQFLYNINSCENSLNKKYLSESNITASLIDHNNNTLLLEKLSGKSLNLYQSNLSEKIAIAINLMAKFHHQFKATSLEHSPIDTLKLSCVFDELMNYAQIARTDKANISAYVAKLINNINDKNIYDKGNNASDNVVCHGDINFTNILIDQNKYWLIDFESTCLMPAEYDIAMMLAVNEITISYVPDTASNYIKQANKLSEHKVKINEELISLYYCVALLINGLWYLGRYHERHNDLLLKKAKQQLKLLSYFYPDVLSVLP